MKVGDLPTMIYLANNPNSNEDEFIGNDKRCVQKVYKENVIQQNY